MNARRYPATFSDLALLPPDAELWHGDAGMVAARCPSRPDYSDGHAVYVPLASDLDLDGAVQVWDEHIGEHWSGTTIRLCVEAPPDVAHVLTDPEWQCERRAVLQRPLDTPLPIPAPSPQVRRCQRLSEWEALLALWNAAHSAATDDFMVWRAEQLRRRPGLCRGDMWGWFEGTRALAGAGAYETGPLWRLQEVVTHPDWRRRGLSREVCAALLAAGGDAVPTVVAHHGSTGQRLYESLGFQVVSEQHVLTAQRS